MKSSRQEFNIILQRISFDNQYQSTSVTCFWWESFTVNIEHCSYLIIFLTFLLQLRIKVLQLQCTFIGGRP